MSDELERLRDVARAAGAHVKAEADYDSLLSRLRLRSEDEWTQVEVEELHRLSLTGIDCYQELIRALDRLAKLDPPRD
jgi:hypothetical protein